MNVKVFRDAFVGVFILFFCIFVDMVMSVLFDVVHIMLMMLLLIRVRTLPFPISGFGICLESSKSGRTRKKHNVLSASSTVFLGTFLW